MLDQERKIYFLFDGDKQATCRRFDIGSIAIDASSEDLDQLIKEHLDVEVKFRQDSNMTDERKRKIRLQYIKFVNSRFRCLPFDAPEEAIWDENTAVEFMTTFGVGEDKDAVLGEIDAKQRFDHLTQSLRPDTRQTTSTDIQSIHNLFIKLFCKQRGEAFDAVERMLREVAKND